MANKTRYLAIDWEMNAVTIFNELDTLKLHMSGVAEDNGSDENGVTSTDISMEIYKVSCSAKPERINFELSIKSDWNQSA
jgi:hypothetical protein